jgi:hypothetical protein
LNLAKIAVTVDLISRGRMTLASADTIEKTRF